LYFSKTKEKFGERIEKLSELRGPYHEVVSRICRIVLDKKITVPGNFTTYVIIVLIQWWTFNGLLTVLNVTLTVKKPLNCQIFFLNLTLILKFNSKNR
jgi:hypothetical protein